MKKVFLSILAGIMVVLLLCTFSFVNTQNHLIDLQEEVNLQHAQVETNLQRRSNLIPNLVATVKAYADHEETVFTEIAEARSKLASSIESGDMESISKANDAFDSALNRLLVLTENYPDLKASKQFIGLQDELAGTENRISVSRQYYNEAVNSYNTAIKKFPASIVSSLTGHQPEKYFEASEEAKEAPTVNFG